MYKIKLLAFSFSAEGYSGFPNYFSLWLRSAQANPELDFLILTDDDSEYDLPNNVKMLRMSFSSLIQQVKSKVDFEINITKPYKFCDMRPMFGFLFPEYFEGYDFWGGCDLDVVFGNLRKYITDDVLRNNDKILSHDHLYLYRNTDEVNNRFKLPVGGGEIFI